MYRDENPWVIDERVSIGRRNTRERSTVVEVGKV